MTLYPLDKKVFILTGNPVQLLSGLTSNTLDAPKNAFLNMHGRIIATFEQRRLSDDEFLLVIATKAVDAVKSHMDRYLKLNRSTLTETSRKVYFDLESNDHILITDKDYPADISEHEFTLYRLEHNIPLHTIDYHDEMLLNVDEHDFVSFTKGCFLGQEMVAKVHNRSKPSWVLKVKYQDELSPQDQSKMTSTVLDPKTQRVLGFVFLPNA